MPIINPSKINIIIIAIISFIFDYVIASALIWFWLLLFNNKTIIIILIIITLIIATKYAVGQISWTGNKIKELTKE